MHDTNVHYYNKSVDKMLDELGWESLASRRIRTDMTTFYKIQHALIAVPVPQIVVRPLRPSPDPEKRHHFQRVFCSTDSYMYSYFPRAIRQWNDDLPAAIATESSLLTFKAALSTLKF